MGRVFTDQGHVIDNWNEERSRINEDAKQLKIFYVVLDGSGVL